MSKIIQELEAEQMGKTCRISVPAIPWLSR